MFHPPLPPVHQYRVGDPRLCECACHCAAAGEQGEIRQRLHADGEGAAPDVIGARHTALYHATRNAGAYVGVLTDDVTEAAVACDACRAKHCPALSGPALPPKPVPAPRERTPYVESLPPAQADGASGEKGDESGG